MKKLSIFLVITILIGCLTACGAQNKTVTGGTDNPQPDLQELTGTVAIQGEAQPDQVVTAQDQVAPADAKFVYEWAVDGQVLTAFKGTSCHIPATAAGKQLTVAVKPVDATAYKSNIASEVITVGNNTNTKMTMAGLYHDVKILGRTPVEGTGIRTAWPGSGFEIKVNSTGGALKLGYNVGTATMPYFCILVDGKQIDRPMFASKQEYAIALPAGEHTVTVYRDSANAPWVPCTLDYIDFDGQILDRPTDKQLYIEVIGASASCGLGALGTYTPGVNWREEEHSVSGSYAWYVAQDFSADISVVAKGGIGAVAPINEKTMVDIYPYINGFVSAAPYDFTRKPDLVIVGLGGNDAGYSTEEFATALTLLYQQILDNYGEDTKILWFGKIKKFYDCAVEVGNTFGDNCYAFLTTWEATGSSPGSVASPHPTAQEHRALADSITKYIKDNNILP